MKAIKAIFVLSNNNDTPPKIHNLVRLAQLSRLELTDEQIDLLDRINDFNLEARYPDYKFLFINSAQKTLLRNISIKQKSYSHG